MERQVAAEWIEKLVSTMKEETSGKYPDPKYKDEVYEALNEAIEILKQEWIPVSEGMPEKDGWYLVTERGKVELRKWERNERFPNGLIGWQTNFCAGITAWMPLPEPYKKMEGERE